MLPSKLSFIDVETTGTSPQYGRIIEVGIVRVEDGQVIEEFSSLVNPGMTVDPFIFEMTGIDPAELENAPSFYQLKDKIKELLAESIFVAHNAMFDYSFIKREFERYEESFTAKSCCSVKLSRKLYPRFKYHNLDAIIERFNFTCQRRHRAFDDAKILWDFYQVALEEHGEENFAEAIAAVMKRPTLPVGISEAVLDSLPESSGVYIFYSKDNVPLYVGKSVSVRNRVMSHFSNSKRESTDMKIAQEINRIEVIETAGELGALLLEATLVKKMQPLYNRQLRYAAKLLALKRVSRNGYNSVSIELLQEIPIEELNQVLGIFKSQKELKGFLITIAKEFNLCLKLLGAENTTKSCFNYHLGLCFGACSGKELTLKYNLRFEEAFLKTRIREWPFNGPIAVKEKSRKEEIFIIDKWCVLGSLRGDSESIEDIQREYLFDKDTYRILNRYLNGSRELEIIETLNF